MERIVEQGRLYDFYGVLLTEHQRIIYEDAVYNDLSLAEIAEKAGISRQGVHDLIRRCDGILRDYEEKLHLIDKFDHVRARVAQIDLLADNGAIPRETAERIRQLSDEILEEL